MNAVMKPKPVHCDGLPKRVRIEQDVSILSQILRQGGIIACPTEAVWGLSCDPNNENAVMRLLALKQRAIEKGLILVAANAKQLNGWINLDELPKPRREAVLNSWPGPHTWAVPAAERAHPWLTGRHNTLAVRVSDHPLLQAVCLAWGGPLVSTSANYSTHAPARQYQDIDPALLQQIDAVLDGPIGHLLQPTPITVASSGQIVRYSL